MGGGADGYASKWMQSAAVRKAIHIGNLTMGSVDQYSVMILSGDVMNSSRPYIEGVLQGGIPVSAQATRRCL